MKGIVEIYSDGELIHTEDNILVDGASRLLANIMTVSPSLSGIQNSATSSILDASNYRVQAISFGKGDDGYKNNAHTWTSGKTIYFANLGVLTSLANPVVVYGSPSSYVPYDAFVQAPTPLDTRLTAKSDVSAVNQFLGVLAFSSVIMGNGHNMNLLPPTYAGGALADPSLSTLFAGQTGAIFGCYAESSAAGGSDFYIFSSEQSFTGGFASSIASLSGTYSGLFNSASSMDMYGHVNLVASSWNDARYGGTNPFGPNPSYSGLIVSAQNNFSSTGEIQYIVTIGSGDVGMSNLYGGIYNMGLWYIDVKDTLQSGSTPPFPFRTVMNPRRYRLFSKKSFSKNLCSIKDNGTTPGSLNHKDLRIVWRIKLK